METVRNALITKFLIITTVARTLVANGTKSSKEMALVVIVDQVKRFLPTKRDVNDHPHQIVVHGLDFSQMVNVHQMNAC
jgi:hypothetical protein